MEIETIEEAAEKYENENYNKYDNKYCKDAFIEGAKWQQERSYSEAEVLKIINKFNEVHYHPSEECEITEWFEKYKKK